MDILKYEENLSRPLEKILAEAQEELQKVVKYCGANHLEVSASDTDDVRSVKEKLNSTLAKFVCFLQRPETPDHIRAEVISSKSALLMMGLIANKRIDESSRNFVLSILYDCADFLSNAEKLDKLLSRSQVFQNQSQSYQFVSGTNINTGAVTGSVQTFGFEKATSTVMNIYNISIVVGVSCFVACIFVKPSLFKNIFGSVFGK